MIFFISACFTVLKILYVRTAFSHECLAALSYAAVPWSNTAGDRQGAVGLVHRICPFSLVGAIMAYTASETMMPRCPNAPPPKCVSIARAFACNNFRMSWIF
jgi:hypothetical protein